MSAISPTVVFSQCNVPNVDSLTESDWLFGFGEHKPPLSPPGPITNRYVYVFQSIEGAAVHLAFECFADSTGELSVCEAREWLDNPEVPPKLRPTGTTVFSLLDNINGDSGKFFFFATSGRLSLRAIQHLASKKPEAVPLYSVRADNATYEYAARNYVVAIDPLFIASQLNLYYQEACNALINETIVHKDTPPSNRERMETEHNKFLVTNAVDALLKAPEGEKLKSCFADGTGAALSSYVENRKADINVLVKERDRRGALLCHFLRSKLLLFTEELCRFDEESHFPAFLEQMALACRRLHECPNGRARLAFWLEDQPEWVALYVLPRDNTVGMDQVVRKSIDSIVKFWCEFIPALTDKYKDDVARVINEAAGRLRVHTVHDQWIKFAVTSSILGGGSWHPGYTPLKTRAYAVLEALPGLYNKLQDFTKDAERSQRAVEALGRAAEVGNLLLALYAISDELDDAGEATLGISDRNAALMNLVGSGLDTVGAFQAFRKIGEVGLLRMAAFSAALDTVLAARDGVNAYEKDDTAAVIGSSAICVGSATLFLGSLASLKALSLAAAGATASVIAAWGMVAVVAGVTGAVVVLGGYLVVWLLQDTRLETFVKHAYFGRNHGNGSADEGWSVGKLEGWASGLEGSRAQVGAWFNLLFSFKVQAGTRTAYAADGALRIYYATLTADSVFRFQFDAQWVHSVVAQHGKIEREHRGNCELQLKAAEPGKVTFVDHSGVFEQEKMVTLGSEDGLEVIEVTLRLKNILAISPVLEMWNLNIDIQLDQQGDGRVIIPRTADKSDMLRLQARKEGERLRKVVEWS